MRRSDPHTGLFQRLAYPIDGAFELVHAQHERIDELVQTHIPFVEDRKLTAQILELRTQLLKFTHFLRRSFASLGESRVALAARPATVLTPPNPYRNLHMETAMSGTRRLIPERAEVIRAYRMVTNPELYADEPDLHEKMQKAWQVLLADRRMRIEAKRAAQTIRSTFPGDAA